MENPQRPSGRTLASSFSIDINPREESEEVYSVKTKDSESGSNDLGVAFPAAFPAGYKIPWAQLPHPFTGILGTGASSTFGSAISFSIIHCLDRSNAVGRPLTIDESNALVYHGIKGISIASYGPILGSMAGFTRYRMTVARRNFRYPFYQPDVEKLNINRFLGLRDRYARVAWRLSSLSAYVLVGSVFGRWLVGTYAASVSLSGELNDQRLKGFFDELKQNSNNRRQGMQLPSPQSNSPDTYDNSSPQSQYDNTETSSWSTANQSGVMSDAQVASSNQSSSSGFDFDDASPVARTAPDFQSTNDSSSAWERLRRGQTPQSSLPPSRSSQSSQQQQQQSPSATGDNLANYEGTEAERQRSKEQAQKEFDARLDRERRGENFDDDDRRWK